MKNGTRQGISPKAVLLDLDDTLIIDDALTEQSWRTACRQFAPLVGSISEEELYNIIRKTGNRYWEDPEQHRKGRLNLYQARREVVRLAFGVLGINLNKIADELADTYSFEKERATTLVPGALDTLHCLKESGKRLALLTNGSPETQRRKIERFGLAPFFNYILIEGEFGAGKPDERVFRAALERLQVAAPEACMVGDDLQRDIAGARRSGIYNVWVDWRGKGLPVDSTTQPDCIIRRIPELLDHVMPDEHKQ
jgi:putative hydrolase of the HAD superfamily